jgi:hypothetical protein
MKFKRKRDASWEGRAQSQANKHRRERMLDLDVEDASRDEAQIHADSQGPCGCLDCLSAVQAEWEV